MNIFDSYEVQLLEEDGKANFVGYKEITMSDLYDLDLIADADIRATAQTRFSCTFDYENGIVVLSALIESDIEAVVLDEIYGVIFMDEDKKFDVAFAIEDDILLLSEMREAGIIDECGLFSKIGSTMKNVWNTGSGKIGMITTVAACAAVGAVCAVVPGGQLATAVCIGIAVGMVGGAVTAAAATYEADGEVDLEAVGICAGVGATVGTAVSAGAYVVGTAVNGIVTYTKAVAAAKAQATAADVTIIEQLLSKADHNVNSTATYIGKFISNSASSYEQVAKRHGGNFFQLDNWDYYMEKYGAKAMEELNKAFIQVKFWMGNDFYCTVNPNDAKNLTGGFAN